MAFKKRLVQTEADTPHSDFWGGWAVALIVPPHNTATAGFGEALAASILVKKARNLDTEADEKTMLDVMAFLMRNQWQKDSCYACSPKVRVTGGFSEHMAAPMIRIDYVQHAWAALAHGARSLNFPWTTSLPIMTMDPKGVPL